MPADQFNSYDLNNDYKNRYFQSRVDLLDLLKSVRKWLKINEEVRASSISINHWYDENEEEIVWEATVLYHGKAV